MANITLKGSSEQNPFDEKGIDRNKKLTNSENGLFSHVFHQIALIF